jgi:hypothetical protein
MRRQSDFCVAGVPQRETRRDQDSEEFDATFAVHYKTTYTLEVSLQAKGDSRFCERDMN